jgi:hypothetical protein
MEFSECKEAQSPPFCLPKAFKRSYFDAFIRKIREKAEVMDGKDASCETVAFTKKRKAENTFLQKHIYKEKTINSLI